MKKKSTNKVQINGGAHPRFGRKLASQSLINNTSTENEDQSKLRRSTRKATIERRVWYPPQKEKFYTQRKYSNKGKARGTKSAYVKWKESQKRKLGCGLTLLRKSKVSTKSNKKGRTQNGGNFPSLSNGSYLLGKLDREGLIVENEVASLQSVITDEVVKDSFTDTHLWEVEDSELKSGKAVLEAEVNVICANKSSNDIDEQSDSVSTYKPLSNSFRNLSSQTSTLNVLEQEVNTAEQKEETDSGMCLLENSAINDDTHVSLDDALAELVDLEHGNECETVTIHPVYSEQKVHTDTLPIPVEEDARPLNLIVSKFINFDATDKNDDIQADQTSLINDEKQDFNDQSDSENICNFREEQTNTEAGNKMPALIKVPHKSPSIRTPLKCSECPMRFCTVRSLLWHFGTHLKLRSKQEFPIILEDLIAAWDTPEKPIQIGDMKSYNYKTEQKWPWSVESQTNGEFFQSSPYLDYDSCPEDLSLDKSVDNDSIGINGEVILKVPAIPKPKISLPYTPTKYSPLRDILTFGNMKNSKHHEPLKSVDLTPEHCITDLTKSSTESCYNSNVRQISNFLPPTSLHAPTQITPTISMCSSTLDTYPTDANIRLLSCVSNTLNKIDTTVSTEPFSAPQEVISTDEQVKECDMYHFNDTDDAISDDSLVRINDNLALRIVSTSTTVGELTISVTNSLEVSKKSSQFTNSVTIIPQTKVSSELSQTVHTPDILTIVPQSEAVQSSEASSMSPPHLITATGKLTPDSSQVVKLILMPQEANAMKRECDSPDDSSEESDCGMVIDVKDEENGMDPLSLCSVTLDDEASIVRVRAREESPTINSKNRMEKKVKNHTFRPRVDDEIYRKRKYVCQYCQKRFGWSTDLKRHIILHTGERPFKCKWCPITFTRKFLSQNHMRKMHPQLCKWSDLWQ